MGEMAEYMREQQEDEWIRSPSFDPTISFEQWCIEEGERERQRELEEDRKYQTMQQAIEGVYSAICDGTYWFGGRSTKLAINKMTIAHAENVIGWLERRATVLHDHACLRMLRRAPSNLDPVACGHFDEAFDSLNGMDAKEWLNEQPLMKNLRVRAERKLVKIK